MIRKLILWLFGAYLVKKFSLIDLGVVGALQGAMAIKSSIDQDTRVEEALAISHPLVWTWVPVWSPLLLSRESATKKTLKNINPLMLDFLKNLEVLKHFLSIPFAYFK